MKYKEISPQTTTKKATFFSRENRVVIGTVRRIKSCLYYAEKKESGFLTQKVYWKECWQ